MKPLLITALLLFVSICFGADMNAVSDRREKDMRLYRLDRNNDGFLTPEEWNIREDTFKKYDTDGDGKLSKEELEKFPVTGVPWKGRVVSNVVYKTAGGKPQLMDIYYPENFIKESAPAVILIHGGGWTTGSKSGAGNPQHLGVFEKLSAAGIICASINYRLIDFDGDLLISDCVTDAKDSIRYLVKHAAELGIDSERIAVFGNSAGGHCSQIIGLSSPESFPGAPELADIHPQIAAIAVWYGRSDFVDWDPDKTKPNRYAGRIGGAYEEIPDVYRALSPIYLISSNSPPLILFHGENDSSLHISQSRRMKTRGDEAGATIEYIEVKNAGHNWRNAGGTPQPSIAEIQQVTADFLIRNLIETR